MKSFLNGFFCELNLILNNSNRDFENLKAGPKKTRKYFVSFSSCSPPSTLKLRKKELRLIKKLKEVSPSKTFCFVLKFLNATRPTFFISPFPPFKTKIEARNILLRFQA